jgi:hypothetical protein
MSCVQNIMRHALRMDWPSSARREKGASGSAFTNGDDDFDVPLGQSLGRDALKRSCSRPKRCRRCRWPDEVATDQRLVGSLHGRSIRSEHDALRRHHRKR